MIYGDLEMRAGKMTPVGSHTGGNDYWNFYNGMGTQPFICLNFSIINMPSIIDQLPYTI